MPTRKRDISSWVKPDISRLSPRGKKRYYKRKNAIEDYFTTDDSVEEITLRHHLSSEILMKLVEQCLMQHEDRTLWGYRALFPGAIVIDHTPLPVSIDEDTLAEELLEAPKKAISEEVLDAISCESNWPPLDNKKYIEDVEATAKRQAIKIFPAAEPVETVAPNSLNGIDKHQTGVAEKILTAVANEEDKVIEVEVAESADVSTELVTIAAEEEQEAVSQHDASANKHHSAFLEEETEDISILPQFEKVEAVAENATAEVVDSKEEKSVASKNDA